MRERNFTININKLDVSQLEQLAAMFYCIGNLNEVKEINNRIAFLRGWMSEKAEAEHIAKFC